MARRDIIIEFIGLPGAGKTTLAAALARRLAAEYDVDLPERGAYRRKELTVAEKLRLDLRYGAAALPYRLRRLAHDVRTAGIGAWTVRNSWDRSRYPLVLLDRAWRAPRQFHVLDEWLVHRTIDESITRYDADDAFTAAFALPPATPLRLVYVSIRVEPATACDRVMAQDQPFRQFAKDKDRRRIEQTLAHWQRQLELLQRTIDARGCLRIDVDGSAGLDANIALLHERLRRLAAAGDRPTTQPQVTSE